MREELLPPSLLLFVDLSGFPSALVTWFRLRTASHSLAENVSRCGANAGAATPTESRAPVETQAFGLGLDGSEESPQLLKLLAVYENRWRGCHLEPLRFLDLGR